MCLQKYCRKRTKKIFLYILDVSSFVLCLGKAFDFFVFKQKTLGFFFTACTHSFVICVSEFLCTFFFFLSQEAFTHPFVLLGLNIWLLWCDKLWFGLISDFLEQHHAAAAPLLQPFHNRFCETVTRAWKMLNFYPLSLCHTLLVLSNLPFILMEDRFSLWAGRSSLSWLQYSATANNWCPNRVE